MMTRWLGRVGATLLFPAVLPTWSGVALRFGYDCPPGGMSALGGDSDAYYEEMSIKQFLLGFGLALAVPGTVLILARWRLDWSEPALQPSRGWIATVAVLSLGMILPAAIALAIFTRCPP